ncbi:MAG: hypothetical protein VB817_08825, partial [Pirellulaceae bacterium]
MTLRPMPGRSRYLLALLLVALACSCRKALERPDTPSTELSHELELDPAKQKAIWDAEHITFVLEHRFGDAFLKAWKRKDRQALLSHFARASVASYPTEKDLLKQEHAGVHERRWEVAPGQTPQADDAELVDFLVALLNPFDQLDSIGMRVTRIKEQEGGGNSWWARILITLRGSSPGGQVAICETIHEIKFSFASEEELALERILHGWHVKSVSHRTTRQSLFREVTSEVGLDQVPIPDNWNLEPHRAFHYRFQVAVDDYDLDGYPDLAGASYDGR